MSTLVSEGSPTSAIGVGCLKMFENLTFAPIDKDLIDIKILNKDEKNWLNEYHKKVFDKN